MDYFINIKLKPDAEMRENVLLNKVYIKLHKALFDINSTSIGVSFPAYKVTLGAVIRLHGSVGDLEKLQSMNWLGGLSGYCGVSESQKVPDEVLHRVVSRKQSNMTQAKLNRLIKRGSITPEETKNYRAKMFATGLDEPYLELESTSNGNRHRRYIQFSELKAEPSSGDFDSFGLSKTATIPWF